jgi:tetratricopeptide (TPR) repeat protein
MLAATRRNGMVAYELPPSLDALLMEVAGGTPVIVLQNLAFNWYPLWHYAVVVGYDIPREEIILRSGREKRQVLQMTTFERTWGRGGFWAMAALPPGKLPRTAVEEAYVASAVALEKTGKAAAANRAYATALHKWPDNLAAVIGLGNTFYALGNLGKAERAFRDATMRHPGSAAAFNNLAQVLSDLKRYGPALEAARKAVSLGGAQRETYQETLTQIQKKLRK